MFLVLCTINNKGLTTNTLVVIIKHSFDLVVNISERTTINKDRLIKQRINKLLL
ncbi:hypothetical protein E27107_90268 [Elizabethkingia anophelis]|nr:hypothetical protein E18064_60419 [Elizabethkingia anophelis]CDN80180.1 hypothetical protein E27107_90268 [Elizabethkingia anophelis]